MPSMNTITLRPKLVVGEADHRKLIALALAGSGHTSEAADELLYELDRARIVSDKKLIGAVRMGSSVTYRPDNGEARTVTLVYPVDADISAGRISVLTPIGTALIGLSEGQSITWTARNGQRHVLTVLEVHGDASPD